MSRGFFRAVYSVLFDDPDYQKLSARARLVLLTARQCQDAGPAAIFRYYPDKLAHQTGVTTSQVREALTELEAGGWVVHDEAVLWVVNGLRHDPHMRLANERHLANIRRWLESLPKAAVVLKMCDYYKIAYPSDTHAGRYPAHAVTEQEQEKEKYPSPLPPAARERALRRTPGQGRTPLLDGFEALWSAYPRRTARRDAERAWTRLRPPPDLRETILAAVTAQLRPGGTLNPPNGPRFIPHAATWLNGRRWEDAAPAAKTADPLNGRREWTA